jgi:uncharacterized protein (DUF58 family)
MATASAKLKRLSRPGSQSSALVEWLERAHLTVAGAAVVGVAVCGWLVARLLGSKTLYLLVYAGLITLGVSYAVARRRLSLEVDRSDLPARMREGQSAEVVLKLKAKRRATIIVVEENLHPALGKTVRVPVAAISGGEEIEHTYSFSPTRRGVYEVGPTSARWSDPFGLTTQHQELAKPTKIIVHPSTELVHDRILTRMWEDPPIRPPSSKPWPTGFEFYGMRDYVRGDDLRRVVWSAVAKTGRMLVRESEQGITDRVSIVLDTHREWHKPGEPSDTFEAAVRTVASLGVRHLGDGFSVTVSTNERRLGENLRGPRARYSLLDDLAMVQMSKAPLTSCAQFLMGDARRGSHFVIVTPHLDQQMASRMRMVLERGASVVVVKIVWDESDPQSLARAVSLGCQVVQVPLDSSIEAAFTHQVGGGIRR